MRFDFNEINILKQNLHNNKQKKSDFLEMLNNILKNTEDYMLQDAVRSLIQKVSQLSQEDLFALANDLTEKRIVATMNSPFPVSSRSKQTHL